MKIIAKNSSLVFTKPKEWVLQNNPTIFNSRCITLKDGYPHPGDVAGGMYSIEVLTVYSEDIPSDCTKVKLKLYNDGKNFDLCGYRFLDAYDNVLSFGSAKGEAKEEGGAYSWKVMDIPAGAVKVQVTLCHSANYGYTQVDYTGTYFA